VGSKEQSEAHTPEESHDPRTRRIHRLSNGASAIRADEGRILEVSTRNSRTRIRGARVDEIANQTRTTKRMIYYYFGSKERLYAALERAYEDIRVTEANVDVEHLDPVTAIRTLAQLTFDRHEANPDFSRLISQENVQRAQFVTAASGFPGWTVPSSRCRERPRARA